MHQELISVTLINRTVNKPIIYYRNSSAAERSIRIAQLDLPNIYAMNDKRYEIRWLNYMRDMNLSQWDVIIADAGSAEALLRYLETPTASQNGVAIDRSAGYIIDNN